MAASLIAARRPSVVDADLDGYLELVVPAADGTVIGSRPPVGGAADGAAVLDLDGDLDADLVTFRGSELTSWRWARATSPAAGTRRWRATLVAMCMAHSSCS